MANATPVRSYGTTIREFDPRAVWSEFATVVSLHAHTHHSREVLVDLPRYVARIPLVAAWFERELQSYVARTGCPVDFSQGWWHPPVSPREVFESECAQVESRFGLSPLVSITDHDSITAGIQLQAWYAPRRAPVSFEWTVPYGAGFFHLGVHNLPSLHAQEWFTRLAGFTANPEEAGLGTLLRDLAAEPELLTVFNHPCWDLAGVGAHVHASLLKRFLEEHGRTVHALELNGYRSRKENARVEALSASTGLPLVSGGDRHGRTPNALLNVTAAASFGEFAQEVRAGASHIVVMPEYREHLVARKLATAADVLRRYPRYPAGRRHWTDRVSYASDGRVRPLSHHWRNGVPLWVRSSIVAFRLLTSPVVLPIVRRALETVDPLVTEEGAAI